MKQYKLLKELPGIEVGTIISHDEDNEKYFFENGAEVHREYNNILSRIFNKSYPDFFEEVKENKSIYDLEKGDTVYWIEDGAIIQDISYTEYISTYDACEFFLTKKEAQRELAMRLLRNRKNKWLPKEGEGAISIIDGEPYYMHKEDVFAYNIGIICSSKEEREEVLSTIVDEGLTIKDLIFTI